MVGRDRFLNGSVVLKEDEVLIDMRVLSWSQDDWESLQDPHSIVFSDPFGIVVLNQWFYASAGQIYVFGYSIAWEDMFTDKCPWDSEAALSIHWIFECT